MQPLKRRFPLKSLIFILVILALAGGAYYRFSSSGEQISYITRKARLGTMVDSVLATGTLEPSRLVSVGAQVSGQIQTIYVSLGDHVSKGQVLAEIDPSTQLNAISDAKSNVANLKAQMAAQEAELKKSELALARQERLRKANATTAEALEAARSLVSVNRADLVALGARLDQAVIAEDTARIDLDYTKITAPMDGTVISIPVKAGQTVNAVQSAPTIVKLADLDTMTVRAEVSEADIVRIRPGQKVHFSILGEPDHRYETTVRSIEPAPRGIDTTDRLENTNNAIYYDALFDIANPDGLLRTWMTVEATIVTRTVENALIIPSAALNGPDEEGKYTVKTLTPEGKVEEVPVEVGINTNLETQIRSGLSEGQSVIIGFDATGNTSQASSTPGHPRRAF